MNSVTQTTVKPKVYHLIDNGASSIELYQRINDGQRVRITGRRNDRPLLQVTFTDVSGNNKTIRFKMNCDTIDMQEQIEVKKILANEKFTDFERDELRIVNGVLVAQTLISQKFLDAHPENENFKGYCPETQNRKMFREFDPQEETKGEIASFRRTAEAANKILSLDLEGAQAMLIRLNGVASTPPEELDDCVKMLINILDESDADGVEEIMRDGRTLEDEITIVVGTAIQKGVLSFDESGMENFVVLNKNGRTVAIKEISYKLPLSERQRLFQDFLALPEGSLHLQEIRTMINAEEKKDDPDTILGKDESEDIAQDSGSENGAEKKPNQAKTKSK